MGYQTKEQVLQEKEMYEDLISRIYDEVCSDDPDLDEVQSDIESTMGWGEDEDTDD